LKLFEKQHLTAHGTQTTEGTGKRILRKQRRLITHFRRKQMNTLTLIKNQIQKAAALHDAQIHVTRYRGVDCKVHEAGEETHGTYCYRGRTYVK
jgi:hypothetical protein